MKRFFNIALLSSLLALFVFSDMATGQLRQRRNVTRPNSSSAMLDRADEISFRMSEIMAQYVAAETPKRYDLTALKETVKISNQSGAKLVADFYATSNNENVALSPPTMLATFAALTHMAKGKTKNELQKLLSLNGTEKTAFGNLENYLKQSYACYPNAEELALKESLQNAGQYGNWWDAVLQDQIEQPAKQLFYKKLGKQQADEYQRLTEELDVLKERLDSFEDPTGMPLSESVPSGVGNIVGENYNSVGYLLLNNQYGNASDAIQKTYLKQFGTKVETTDFSQEGVKKYNDEIKTIVGDFGGGDEGVIEAKVRSIVACSAMILNFDWGFIMDQEERPFNFDTGRKNFTFLKGDLKVQNVTVNDKIGYSFPIGLTDMILVKCKNGADLKQLAKTIALEGVKIESAGIRLRNVGLYLPYVGFQTKFDFKKYAQNKGLSIPFTEGQAEYALSDDINIPYPCYDARVDSLFQVDETGVLLKQITIAGIPLPVARNQRTPDRIIIDSPFLMILADRNLGTILGMAFIASPVFDSESQGFDNPDLDEFEELEMTSNTDSVQTYTPPRTNTSGTRGNSTPSVNTSRSMSLERGDVILAINGERINGSGALTDAVNRSPQTVYLTIRDRRNGQIIELATNLNSSRPRLGVTGQPYPNGGARITQVDRNSPAARCYLVE